MPATKGHNRVLAYLLLPVQVTDVPVVNVRIATLAVTRVLHPAGDAEPAHHAPERAGRVLIRLLRLSGRLDRTPHFTPSAGSAESRESTEQWKCLAAHSAAERRTRSVYSPVNG